MINESPYQRMLNEYLKGELRVLNAQLPRQRKPLAELLAEKYPHVVCADDNAHLFKKKELAYLSNITTPEEQKALLLPILIEVGPDEGEVSVICGDIEEKVVSKILNMPVTCIQGKVRIYKPQLGVLRKVLKTTSQYIFSAGISRHLAQP